MASPRAPHRLVSALLAAALALGLLGVGAVTARTRARAADPKTLTIALTQEIDTLNPFQAVYRSSTQIGRLMYDFLTAYSPADDAPVPGLATSWKTSPDKLTWTYTIRKNATWSDGKPVTARDAAFTYNLMMHNPDAAVANGNFVANFSSVTAPNDTTLVIKTSKPQATMLALDVPIVPEHAWKGVKDIKNFKNESDAVSDGPFQLTDYKENQYAKFKANPTYWRGKAKIDTLIFQEYKNSDAAVQALRKGEVDMVSDLTAAQANALKSASNVRLNVADGKRFYEISMNPGAENKNNKALGNGNPALADVRVRRAIDTAIDRQTIVSKVLGGYGQVGSGYIPEVYATYHWKPSEAQQRKFSISQANRMLDSAGYERGSDGVRHMPNNGKALVFRLTTHNDSPADHPIAQYVTGWLKQIGITVKEQIESDDKLNEDLLAGNYDLVAGGWTVNPDPDYVLAIQTCSARGTSSDDATTDDYWCDPAYDKLYDQQLSTFDRDQRAAIVKQMEQIFYDQVPSVVLYYPGVLEAYRSDRFGDFVKQPGDQGQILNQDGFWGIYSATPKGADSGSASGDSGGGGGLGAGGIVGIVVAVVVVGGIAAFLVTRRRRTAAERE